MVDEDGDYAGEVVRDVADREWWETSSTELGLESLEKEECYVECLGALSTAHQRVLELTLVAGLHPTEIAEATEQKLETVKTRLHYAAKKMTGCVVDCANGHKA
jgi:DNA-directed RNA polymerase specialized sigma24 family protein